MIVRRSQNELIKRFASDYAFPVKQKRLGKKYGNIEGVDFRMDDIEYLSTPQKASQKQSLLSLYGGKLFACL